MALGGVVQVLHGGSVGEGVGGLVVVVVLLQDLDGLVPVRHVGVLGDVIVADVVLGVAGVHVELGAVGVGHAHGNEARSGNLAGLADLLDDVVAIQQQAHRLADLHVGGLSLDAGQLAVGGQQVLVDVPAHIVGADLAGDEVLGGILGLQALDLLGGNVVNQLPGAVFEVGQHVVGVVREVELDGVHQDGVRIDVVGVLGQRDLAVVLPAGDGVRAVAHVGGGIGGPGFVGNHVLANRVVCREGHQLVPVGNSVVQGHFQGLVIDGGDSQIIRIALDNFEHVAVVGAQLGGGSALPCELEVARGDRLAVGPGQAVLQGVGVGHGAVLVLNAFGQLLGGVGNDDQVALLVLGPLGQAGEQVRGQGRAIDCGVQRGIDGVGFRGDADSDGSGGFFCQRDRGAGENHGQNQHESNELLHDEFPLLIIEVFIL